MTSSKTRPCRKCGRNRAERFFTSARGHVCSACRKNRTRTYSRGAHLMDTYGISLAEYEWMLEQQGGVCAGCLGHRRVYDVDHDHKLEKQGVAPKHTVRGGLCRSDNKILAMARDDPARLRRLADYLERGPVWPQA